MGCQNKRIEYFECYLHNWLQYAKFARRGCYYFSNEATSFSNPKAPKLDLPKFGIEVQHGLYWSSTKQLEYDSP